MKKFWTMMAVAASFTAVTLQNVRAEDAKPGAAEAAKVTEIKVCPFMENADHTPDEKKAVTVANYKVYLCCKGCMKQWAKLSEEDKLKKAELALKIQVAAAEKAKQG